MKKLILATHNQGKVRELSELLAPFNIDVVAAGDLGISEPEETEDTFVGNARLKALHSATAANLPALADDSGLCIPALDGQPGIHSARWGGEKKDFVMASARIANELYNKRHPEIDSGSIEKIPDQVRNDEISGTPAYFICVLSLAQPDGSSVEFEGRVDGVLSFPARGDLGFGYDPIFVPNHELSGLGRSFAEMSQLEKNQRNHRAAAFDKFKTYLLKKAA